MWFNARQDFIFAGWLTKMGGGTSTLGRKSWKRRWMTLKGGELHYHPSQEEDATVLGIVDIQNASEVSEVRLISVYIVRSSHVAVFIWWPREHFPDCHCQANLSDVD
jgi:hypothetical protein